MPQVDFGGCVSGPALRERVRGHLRRPACGVYREGDAVTLDELEALVRAAPTATLLHKRRVARLNEPSVYACQNEAGCGAIIMVRSKEERVMCHCGDEAIRR